MLQSTAQLYGECQSLIIFDDSSKMLGFIAVTHTEAGIRLEEMACLETRKKRSSFIIFVTL